MNIKRIGLILLLIQSVCLGQKVELKKQAIAKDSYNSCVPATTIIKGIWERKTVSQAEHKVLILYKVVDGQKIECARVSGINEQHKQFSFAVSEKEEGFYYISDPTNWWYVRLYLKPGDVQELVIFNNTGEYKLLKGTPENMALSKWDRLIWPIVKPVYNKILDSSSYSSYFKTCDSVKRLITGFCAATITPNATFNSLLKLVVATEPDMFSIQFYLTPRLAHTEKDTTRPFAFFRPIVSKTTFCDAGLLRLGDAVAILSCYSTMRRILNERDGLDLICNDTLKGALIVERIKGFKMYEQMKAIDTLSKYLATQQQRQAWADKWKSMDTLLMPGRPAFNFEMLDINNQTVSLHELKGNVVVVDAWATWCGPCKEQIPFLKKMEDELEGQKVKFVSISLDEEKSKEAWANMVKDKQMGGIQLFGKGFDSKFAKFYAIQSIPRFLVFDTNGMIITCNAPRPSEPALKQIILKALADKLL